MRIIIINLSSDFSMTYRRLTGDLQKIFISTLPFSLLKHSLMSVFRVDLVCGIISIA